jgi:glycosyltransferase involved in cell wall biosynthesis
MNHEKKKDPFISIIVPVFNGAKEISDCIESLLMQTYPIEKREIIIVDNNSTDGTDQAIKKFPVKILYEREIQTSYAARNRGLQNARGEIVVFTDSDCVAEPQWVENIVRHFDDKEVGAVSGAVLSWPSSSIVGEFSNEKNYLGYVENRGLISTITANVAFRMSTINELRFFDETLFTGGDVDLGWRIQLIARARVIYDKNSRVIHKHRSTWSGLWRQSKRYGYSEILLATLYQSRQLSGWSFEDKIFQLCHQIKAIIIYIGAFIMRILRFPFRQYTKYEFLKPLLLIVAELGNLAGKANALIDTKLMKQNPFPSRSDIIR